MRPFLSLLFVFSILSFLPLTAFGQVEQFPPIPDSLGRPSLFDALYATQDDILEINLTTDLGTLIKKRTVEAYQPAHIQFQIPGGTMVDRSIEIKARGITRKEICSHPPIKVKFKKKTLDTLGFSKFNEMKVVWQCKPGKAYEQWLCREYLVYRLYNIVSPYSYRVKLLKIHVIDSRDTSKQHLKYGFFLEDDGQLSQRLNGELTEEPIKNASRFIREHLLRFFVFQYMVGNTDWSFGNLHNVRFMNFPELRKAMPIPYDFDYAGVVSAPYAIPHESLPIKDVRERHYQGVECTESEIVLLNKFFSERKPEILDYCEKFPHLDAVTKKDVLSYLNSFFEILDRKNGVGQFIGQFKPGSN